MNPSQERIVELIVANMHHEDIGEDAVEEVKNYDLALGLALQVEAMKRMTEGADQVGGYKVCFNTGPSRDFCGEGYRPFGFVLEKHIFPSGSKIEFSRLRNPGFEPEICAIIGKRLSGPNVSAEEARDAVAAVAPAYELPEGRDFSGRGSRGVSHTIRLANAVGAWGIAVGPEHDLDIDLQSLPIELFHDGKLVDTGDSGPERAENPYLSLALCARELSSVGLAFEPGQRVILGSLINSKAPLPGEWTATFGDLGSVTVNFV